MPVNAHHNSEHPCYLEPRVCVLAADARGLEKTVDHLAKDIWGNGEKGLDERMTTLERWADTRKVELAEERALQARFRSSVRTNLLGSAINIFQALLLAYVLWRMGWK